MDSPRLNTGASPQHNITAAMIIQRKPAYIWHASAMFLPRTAATGRLLSWSVKTRAAHQARADGTAGEAS